MVCRPKNLSYTIPSNMPFVAIFLCMFCEAIFYEHIFIRSNVLHLLICLDVGPRTPVRKKNYVLKLGGIEIFTDVAIHDTKTCDPNVSVPRLWDIPIFYQLR